MPVCECVCVCVWVSVCTCIVQGHSNAEVMAVSLSVFVFFLVWEAKSGTGENVERPTHNTQTGRGKMEKEKIRQNKQNKARRCDNVKEKAKK